MGFIETAVDSEVAKHALRRRDPEQVEESIAKHAERMEKALDIAADDFGGTEEVPDQVVTEIFNDPDTYLKPCVECMEKEYVGFDKLVAKLVSEGHSEESAKRIAASIGRKKYGNKMNAPASSHH